MAFVYLILHSRASKLPVITWKSHSILKRERNSHTQYYSCVPLYELDELVGFSSLVLFFSSFTLIKFRATLP